MGTALENLRDFFNKHGITLNKKSATSLLVLLALLIILPIGIFLVKQQLNLSPYAAGEFIKLGTGGCVKTTQAGPKYVDCANVALTLTNPFSGSNGGSSSPTASVPSATSPSPVASNVPSPSGATTPQNINVKSFNNDIVAALKSIKDTGGSVYVPAGTYTVEGQVTLYSNTTLFGDGIDQTIIIAGAGVDNTTIGNDNSKGQTNIVVRDLTVRGKPNAETLKLRNLDKGFVDNVKVEGGGTGILLGFNNGKGVTNVRISNCQVVQTTTHAIFMSLGENNVIDHCTIDSGGSDSLGIGLEIGVEGKISNNRVISNSVSNGGHSYSLTAGNDTQYDPAWINSNNIVCYNNASGNHIQQIWDQRGTNNLYVGNGVPVANVDSFGYTEIGGTDARCDIPANYAIPAAPAKPTAEKNNQFEIIKTAHAQDSNDIFNDAEDSDSSDQFTNNITNNGSIGNNTAGSGVTYRLAETQAGLAQATFQPFGSANTLNTTFQLSNSTAGAKQIWVEFKNSNGATKIDNVNFQLVGDSPQIIGLSCNLDVSKQNLKINIEGGGFGDTSGKVVSTSPSANAEVLGWNKNQVTAQIKNPSIPVTDGQKFKIKITTAAGLESNEATCAVGKSIVSLGAKIFCREPGKFDATDVTVDLLFNPEDTTDPSKVTKIQEKVAINADGEIQNLKTQLQTGKNYAISIKAPNSLRKSTVFTAQEGTTEILNPDGSTFVLPIGDIAPVINPDGAINTLDRAELIRQWRIVGKGSTKVSGDFNRDSAVNSIDWACMSYDFGKTDDPLPVEVPQSQSGFIYIPVRNTATSSGNIN